MVGVGVGGLGVGVFVCVGVGGLGVGDGVLVGTVFIRDTDCNTA